MRPVIQLRVYNVLSRPDVTYGSKTWGLGAQAQQRISTPQMRFLGSILGTALRNKIRSEGIQK
jgi:hypothetical protein